MLSKPGDCLLPPTAEQVTAASGGWSWLKKLPKNVCVATKETAAKGGSSCGDYSDQASCQTHKECTWEKFSPISDLAGNDCNWWGRGVIQTTGRCNFGKLSKALMNTKQYKPLFKNETLCQNPEMICQQNSDPALNELQKQLRWVSGFFYWVTEEDTVEFRRHTECLREQCQEGGTVDDTGFIHNVSGIVNRGCPDPPCGTGALDAGQQRAVNTCKVLQAMGFAVKGCN